MSKIKAIDWSKCFDEHIKEVKENLEKNSFKSKKSVLGLWLKWLAYR